MILTDADATDAAGRHLAYHIAAGDVITLSGDLGAGKTSFARGLLAGLGLAEDAPSPSFAIVIPYAPPHVRLPVAHVDLYRLNGPDDLDELGLDDVLVDGALIVEWPERLGRRTWPNTLSIHISVAVDQSRTLTAVVPPSWVSRWPFI
jgi:tRNA threonylcarbamoyladenosine biosynthesis protein TsaE